MENLSYRGSNGIDDLAKHLHFADCIQDHNLDAFSLAISETGKRDFSKSLISGGIDFKWFSCPPRERSGGILLGVRIDTMDVLAHLDGVFHIKLHIPYKANSFSYEVLSLCMVLPRRIPKRPFVASWLT
jgi:hypothetical protein